MNTNMRTLWIPVVLAVLAGCGREDTAAPVAAEPAAAAEPALADTAWRLLNIAEMDDSTDIPDDPSKYTLIFGADGSAGMRADCNRGTGSWTSPSPSQLQFGPIAATRALCPPGSLSDKYLAQFERVRSYVLQDGHLYLATLADGAIIEFEPLPLETTSVTGEEDPNR